MNIGNILKVANALESRAIPNLGFNLSVPYEVGGRREDYSGRSCGTVACIAGWAGTIEQHEMADRVDWRGWEEDLMPWAEGYFGIDHETGKQLMSPEDIVCYERIRQPTDLEAARALRILAITGKVDWEAAMKGDEPALPPLPVSRSLVRV